MKKTIFLIDRGLLCPFLYKNSSSYLNLLSLKYKTSLSKFLRLFIIVTSIFWLLPAYSQQTLKTSTIEVGEMLPKEFWSIEHEVYDNGSTRKKNLAPYKGNILLIDVWASWCTNCLYSLPKLDSLVKNSSGKVNAILLNFSGSGDDLNKIKLVYDRYETDHGKLSYPSIINDTLLRDLFSLKTLPQYIWVDREGRVLAKTGSDFLNIENINSIYQSGKDLDKIIVEKRRKKNEKH